MIINKQMKWVSNALNIITDHIIWLKSKQNMIIDEVISNIKCFKN
jgi:hypothetical protein